ncbi:GGDEF domain-containing protein [Campylobacterota bacterium DY0563]
MDYFKLLNDMYGHAYGDEALKKIGECLRETCKRPSDFAFRVGGEEFAIIFNCYKSDACYNLALKLQKNINDLKIESKGSKISDYMTVSIGLVSIVPTDEDDLESVMKTIDKRLYIAKGNGRNQIVRNS